MAEVLGLGPRAAPCSLPEQHHGGKCPLRDDNSQTLVSPTSALNPSHVHPTACLTSPQMYNVQFTECQSSGRPFLTPQLKHLGVTFDSALSHPTSHLSGNCRCHLQNICRTGALLTASSAVTLLPAAIIFHVEDRCFCASLVSTLDTAAIARMSLYNLSQITLLFA